MPFLLKSADRHLQHHIAHPDTGQMCGRFTYKYDGLVHTNMTGKGLWVVTSCIRMLVAAAQVCSSLMHTYDMLVLCANMTGRAL